MLVKEIPLILWEIPKWKWWKLGRVRIMLQLYFLVPLCNTNNLRSFYPTVTIKSWFLWNLLTWKCRANVEMPNVRYKWRHNQRETSQNTSHENYSSNAEPFAKDTADGSCSQREKKNIKKVIFFRDLFSDILCCRQLGRSKNWKHHSEGIFLKVLPRSSDGCKVKQPVRHLVIYLFN